MNTSKFFEEIGLTTQEINTFTELLQFPEGVTVVRLGKSLNLPRPTVYDHLRSLVKRGLARKGQKESGAVYFPETHKAILDCFDERKKQIEDAKKGAADTLKNLGSVSVYTPRFSVFEGTESAERIFWDVLRSREELSLWFWPAGEMINTISERIFREWYNERIRRSMRIRVLWPKNQVELVKDHPLLGQGDGAEALREIRVLPDTIDATMGYGIYGNRVGFIASSREQSGFVIDSRELAENLRSQFEYLWQISKIRDARTGE